MSEHSIERRDRREKGEPRDAAITARLLEGTKHHTRGEYFTMQRSISIALVASMIALALPNIVESAQDDSTQCVSVTYNGIPVPLTPEQAKELRRSFYKYIGAAASIVGGAGAGAEALKRGNKGLALTSFVFSMALPALAGIADTLDIIEGPCEASPAPPPSTDPFDCTTKACADALAPMCYEAYGWSGCDAHGDCRPFHFLFFVPIPRCVDGRLP